MFLLLSDLRDLFYKIVQGLWLRARLRAKLRDVVEPKLRAVVECNQKGRKWADLPTEILVTILTRLCLVDYASARVVCPSWRAAAMEVEARRLRPLSHLLPLQLISEGLTYQGKNMFNLFDKRVYNLHLPHYYGASVAGFFDEWLVVFSLNRLFLLNLFTGKQIPLPVSATVHDWRHLKLGGWHRFREFFWDFDVRRLQKVVLSSPPTSNNCWVATVCGTNSLAFLKLGKKDWSVFKGALDHNRAWAGGEDPTLLPINIAFHGGCACVLNTGYQLMVWKLDGLYPHTIYRIDMHYSACMNTYFNFIFLVESRGELLLVLKAVLDYTFSEKTETIIFKMDCIRRCWVLLENLGDQVIFLGNWSPMSVSAAEVPGFKANTVYITRKLSSELPDDFNGFHVEDGRSIKKLDGRVVFPL